MRIREVGLVMPKQSSDVRGMRKAERERDRQAKREQKRAEKLAKREGRDEPQKPTQAGRK
jgi:hypothetical protein